MIPGTGLSRRSVGGRRLSICVILLAALSACATPEPTQPQPEASAAQVNRGLRQEADLRDQAGTVFHRLLMANADVCRPFVTRTTDADGHARWQCDQQLAISSDNAVNATATPNVVTISIGMLRFLRGDDDLAFILAHELSHNIIAQAAWRSAELGGLKPDFVSVRQTQTTDRNLEAAADYLGIYLAARAGFTMNKAGLLMRSLSALDPDSTPAATAGAHPTIVRRYLAIEQAVREITALQTAGQPLIPRNTR